MSEEDFEFKSDAPTHSERHAFYEFDPLASPPPVAEGDAARPDQPRRPSVSAIDKIMEESKRKEEQRLKEAEEDAKKRAELAGPHEDIGVEEL